MSQWHNELAVEIFTHCSALIEEPDTIIMAASNVFALSWYDYSILLCITAAFRPPLVLFHARTE